MSGFISSQFQFTQNSEVGEATQWFSGTLPVTRFPEFILGGSTVFDYDIPANKILTLKSLSISQNALYKSAISAEGAQLVGIMRIKVNSVTKIEFNVEDPSFALPTGGGNGRAIRLGCWPISIFGFPFTVGDSVELTFETPSGAAGVDPKLVFMTMFGVTSGVASVQKFLAPVQGTQAEQTLLTFVVPAGGFNLKSLMVSGYSWDRKTIAFAKLYLNGQMVGEFLLQPNTEDHVSSVTTIPLWGLKMHDGECIKVVVSDPTYYNAKYSVMLAATSSSSGGESSSVFIS